MFKIGYLIGKGLLWGKPLELEWHPVPPSKSVFRPEIINFSDKDKLPSSIEIIRELFGKGRNNQVPLEVTYIDRYTLEKASLRGIAKACDLIPFSGAKEAYMLTNFTFEKRGDKSFIAGRHGIPVSPCIGNLLEVKVFSDNRFNNEELRELSSANTPRVVSLIETRKIISPRRGTALKVSSTIRPPLFTLDSAQPDSIPTANHSDTP